MPLNDQKPTIIPKPFISKVKDAFTKTMLYLQPEVLIIVFLVISILYTLLRIEVSIGFYISFSVLIAMFFIEKIVKKWRKSKQ